MPNNVLQPIPQILSVLAGMVVLLAAAFVFASRGRTTTSPPGEHGHRPAEEQEAVHRVSPDGYIDSFAGVVSEAGGGMPYMGWIIIGVVLVSYVVYLFLFWR